MRLFEKNNIAVAVGDSFIYRVETYIAYNTGGMGLYDVNHVSSPKPLVIHKKTRCTKKGPKDKWWKVRFIELLFAPENYLINNGYKEIQ